MSYTKPMTVGMLIEALDEYHPTSLVKVYDATNHEIVQIQRFFPKKDHDRHFPDLVLEIAEEE